MQSVKKLLQLFRFNGIVFDIPEEVPGEGKKQVIMNLNNPEMLLEKWNGEVRLGISSIGGKGRIIEDGVEWDTARAYKIDEKTFEFETILREKSQTNILHFQLTGIENLNFFYQPELTQEERDKGYSRPENVVGSYAVYHKTKANHRIGSTNYATGKALHIYRPKAIDANGAEEWAELSYENGILSVIVPQSFLDSAAYPVVADPTFGYTTLGGTTVNIVNDLEGTKFASTEAGTLTKMTAAALENDTGTRVAKTAIYNVDNTFLGGTTETIIDGAGAAFYDFTFSSPPSISAATYWLLIYGENAGTTMSAVYDTDTSVVGSAMNEAGYPTFPDPYVPSADNDRKYSIYATYTTSEVSNEWCIAFK